MAVIASLPATLTLKEARATSAQLAEALRASNQPEVGIDAEALNVFDSSALSVMLQAERDAHLAGKRIVWRRVPARAQALARLYGVHEVLVLG